jgi:hypothetical protein
VTQCALQAITADMLHRAWDEFVYCVDVSCGPACTAGYYYYYYYYLLKLQMGFNPVAVVLQ